MRLFSSVVLSSALTLCAASAHARSGLLLAADDPKQITQLDLAQVMAKDSSHWLSVRLKGRARLALISAGGVQVTTSSDAWLRALDFATRERIAAPPGPLAVCPERATFPLADSGLPELPNVQAEPATTADTDVELQRTLTNAGLQASLANIDEFAAGNPGPYQITWFDAPAAGSATASVRWVEHDASNELPKIRVVGLDSVPVSLIALANGGVSSQAGGEGDPSEFAVKYFALGADSDYVAARAAWAHDNADRWLLEARNTSALFELTVFGGEGQIQPASAHYFDTQCAAEVLAAHTRGSKTADDFSCHGADDLAQALDELDFADVRLTRFYGSTNAASAFLVQPGLQQNPRLQATDFETKGCSEVNGQGVSGGVTPGNGMGTSMGTGTGTGSYTSGSESSTEVTTTIDQTPVSGDDGGCGLEIGSSSDSCSGDSSSSDSSSNDSCSGDSSSSDSSSNDSCSGDSTSDDKSSSDSCSGDSDSSSNDSSGCGSSDKSGYDGDTCSGSSSSSTSQSLTNPRSARPRRVRLSLLTLLAAGLSLPLRRRLK